MIERTNFTQRTNTEMSWFYLNSRDFTQVNQANFEGSNETILKELKNFSKSQLSKKQRSFSRLELYKHIRCDISQGQKHFWVSTLIIFSVNLLGCNLSESLLILSLWYSWGLNSWLRLCLQSHVPWRGSDFGEFGWWIQWRRSLFFAATAELSSLILDCSLLKLLLLLDSSFLLEFNDFSKENVFT